MDRQNSEIKDKIRAWWESPDQDYDGIKAHGVNSEEEKELWRSGLTELLGKKELKILDNAEKLSYPDEKFDAVVSRHVLWTLAGPYAASKEWVRVIRPGGKVIVDVPGIKSGHGDHHFGAEIGKKLPFYNGADPKKISDMLKDAGLSNLVWLLFQAPGEVHRKTVLVYGEKI